MTNTLIWSHQNIVGERDNVSAIESKIWVGFMFAMLVLKGNLMVVKHSTCRIWQTRQQWWFQQQQNDRKHITEEGWEWSIHACFETNSREGRNIPRTENLATGAKQAKPSCKRWLGDVWAPIKPLRDPPTTWSPATLPSKGKHVQHCITVNWQDSHSAHYKVNHSSDGL